jgi:hypothetical protein
MSEASEVALKACVGEVVAFPAFTSFSEGNEAAKEFPCEQPRPDEVKVFFQLDCQGRHRVDGFGVNGVLLPRGRTHTKATGPPLAATVHSETCDLPSDGAVATGAHRRCLAVSPLSVHTPLLPGPRVRSSATASRPTPLGEDASQLQSL